jgi:hypothetical protein
MINLCILPYVTVVSVICHPIGVRICVLEIVQRILLVFMGNARGDVQVPAFL